MMEKIKKREVIIVSRHTATIEKIAATLLAAIKLNPAYAGYPYIAHYEVGEDFVAVLTEEGGDVVVSFPLHRGDVTADHVRGKVVIGNLPLPLVFEAAEYYAVENTTDGRINDASEVKLQHYFVTDVNGYKVLARTLSPLCPGCFSSTVRLLGEGGVCVFCGTYHD